MWKFFVAAAVILLSACSDGDDNTGYSWSREAGAAGDPSNFGSATKNNTSVHNGDKEYVLNLASRFAKEVDSTINFEFDSYQLSPRAQATLRQQANWIRQFPEVRFKVYGHTDAVGSNSYNQRLGLRRARAAVRYLISQGADRDRLEAVVSLGKTQPLIATPGRERKNRRTVTEVSGFVKRHPTVLDGQYAAVVYREYVASGVPSSSLSGISIDGGTSE